MAFAGALTDGTTYAVSFPVVPNEGLANGTYPTNSGATLTYQYGDAAAETVPYAESPTFTLERFYTVTWKDEDGTVLEKDENVAYGETPSYDGAEPTKAADERFTYTFEMWAPEIAPVTGDVIYMAIYSMSPRIYTVTWLDADGSLIDTTEVPYGEMPVHADVTKEADEDYLYTFRGWSPALAPVMGDVTYTAAYNRILRYNVSFQAPDVQYGNTMVPLVGVTDSGAVQQQPNYPSYLGWLLTSVTVTAGAESAFVACENGVIANAALNAALDRVLAASGEKKAKVTAAYERDSTQTYTVALKYQLPDGAVIDNVTLEPKLVGDAMRITTGETFTDGGKVYYFDHWLVDGKAYKSLTITLRPEKAGAYDAVAVYVEGDSAANEPVLQVVNAFAEVQNGIAKTAVTLSYGVPEGYTVQQVGFRVSTKDPTLQDTFSLATSKLTAPDGSYTVHINVNTKKDTPVYVCAYLIVTTPSGTTETILTDPVPYVWNDLNA